MKKISLFLLIFIFVFSAIFVIAQEENEKEEVPPGMEVIKAGTVRVIVPKGSKVHKEGSLITVEDIGAYVARRFLEMEERLAELEAKEERLAAVETEEENLKKEVEQLRKVLDEIKTRLISKESNKEPKESE